ncbi:lysophosphatidic acid receptor 5-like [Dipodomys merriami]|uniref:lysophosphatidic acid receptor 5-like n=1 Tax=Dipodomys merriami TaxID=94247 RepID=UPI003855D449
MMWTSSPLVANSSSDLPSNGTLPPCRDYRATHRVHMAVYSLVLAAGLPLNALALWVFLRALRVHSVVSVYMCNLAASDLLFTLSLPLRLSYYSLHHWPFPDLLCQLSGAVFQINMYGSCIFLMLINVDRVVAIAYPLRLRHLRRPRVARRVCLAVWALILVFAVPAARVHTPSVCSYRGRAVRLCFESFGDELWRGRLLPLVLLAEALGFLAPLAAVLASSGRVFWTLARPRAAPSRRRRTTVRLLLANLLIFLLCFVPYNCTLAVYGLLRAQLLAAGPGARAQVRGALMLTVLLAGANCVLDPLLYYFSAEGFRNTLRGFHAARANCTGAPHGATEPLAGRPARPTHAPTQELLRLPEARKPPAQSPPDSAL